MYDSDSTVPEGFRQIPGYSQYAIDEHGTIISVCSLNGRGKSRPWTNASRLSLGTDKDGYKFVNLCHDGRRRKTTVHKLVLTTFVGPCPDGMMCRHLDGNPANNHVSNLSWGTAKQNGADKVFHGTPCRGESRHNTKLTEKDVLEIRARAAGGESPMSISKDFPITRRGISYIILRETWTHI